MPTETADVVIVGAGIYGAAVAFALTSLGVRGVVVVDKRFPTSGASGRGDGILRIHYANPFEAKLAISSLETYRNWPDVVGGSCGYRPHGFLWIVGPDDVERLRANVALQQSLGGPTELKTVSELEELQPGLDVSGIGAVAYEPAGGAGSATEATKSLLAAARRMGAELRTWLPVRRLTRSRNQVTGVETTEGRISCGTVVLTAGAWSASLAATAGLQIPVKPVRCCTGRAYLPPSLVGLMTFIDTVLNLSFNPLEGGVAHLSTRDHDHFSVVDPDDFVESVAASAGPTSLRELARRLPAAAEAQLGDSWAGVDGVTPDGKAILGPVPGLRGLMLGVGGNFKGFKVAPSVGTCLAQLITTGRSTLVDLSKFTLSRFDRSEAEPWSGTGYASSSLA